MSTKNVMPIYFRYVVISTYLELYIQAFASGKIIFHHFKQKSPKFKFLKISKFSKRTIIILNYF